MYFNTNDFAFQQFWAVFLEFYVIFSKTDAVSNAHGTAYGILNVTCVTNGDKLFFECSLEPDGSYIKRTVKALFLALLDNLLVKGHVLIGALNLNENLCGNIEVTYLLALKYIHKQDILFIGEAVKEELTLSDERLSFIHQGFYLTHRESSFLVARINKVLNQC